MEVVQLHRAVPVFPDPVKSSHGAQQCTDYLLGAEGVLAQLTVSFRYEWHHVYVENTEQVRAPFLLRLC